jgi:DNA replication protein
MKRFEGFPARMTYAAVPEPFFSQVMPYITDVAELKVTLIFFRSLSHKRGSPRFVSESELRADPDVVKALGEQDIQALLRTALDLAVERGTILKITVDNGSASDDLYFLNTGADRQAVDRIRQGEFKLPGLNVRPLQPVSIENRNDVYTSYEQNIGLISPLIADELRDAVAVYPESWIHEAIKEAANHNKRSWSYISAILERWSSEGKTGGTHRGNTAADPDKYIKGKYGHMVQR